MAEPAADSNVLRVMSYNVLQYGGGCQGPDEKLHHYFRRIIAYTKPDILGLLKVAAIGKDAPVGFQDSILRYALQGELPYAACPYTNRAGGKDINLLFYNSSKLGFAGVKTLVSDITDINLFRLYNKTKTSGDTSFLFVVLIHTESGDNSKDRDRQLTTLLNALRQQFKVLPPLLILGDFNLRNTTEPGYALLTQKGAVAPFCDPPFVPDKSLSYPADWDSDPESFAHYLTTSTRKRDGEPNDCGTGGGAKSWYDHILLSRAVVSGTGGYNYVPHSFHVVGNDGMRIGHAVQSDKHPNSAVPADVAEALYQFSNKYPVMLELSR
jgi:endonuclease/exonuclease/phosphatase family metal-dependent hydrolase